MHKTNYFFTILTLTFTTTMHTHTYPHAEPSYSPFPPLVPRPSVHWYSLIAGGESNPWHRMRDCCSPPLFAALLPSTAPLKGTGVFLFFFILSKVWGNEFISAPCSGLAEMKYNGGGSEHGEEMLARRGSCCLSACPWHSASHSSHSKAAELCLPRGSSFLHPPLPSLPPPFHAVF